MYKAAPTLKTEDSVGIIGSKISERNMRTKGNKMRIFDIISFTGVLRLTIFILIKYFRNREVKPPYFAF
jgi:hypothetical protein